jgi:hypothetical protein
MRKVAFYFIFIAICFCGCKKKFLDITPDGRMSLDEIFSDENRTGAYLNRVYGHIPSYYWFYHFYAFLAGITDEAHDSDVGNENSGMANQWLSGALTPAFDPTGDTYTALWGGIYDANVFLENIDNANVTTGNLKMRFKAEAQLLRAFYYSELIKKYGPLPYVDKPFDSKFDYSQLSRPTFQEVTNMIVKDCDEVISNTALPMRITSANERGRMTRAIAYALKSQVLLQNASPLWNPANDLAKWNAAAVASKEALTALTANGNFALFDNYSEYFLNNADVAESPRDRETIFERPLGCNSALINSIPSKPGMMKAGSCPSQELVDSYDMKTTGEPPILGYLDDDHLQPVINSGSGYDPSKPYENRDPRFYATVWYNNAVYDMGSGVLHTMEMFAGGADQLLKSPPNRRNTHTGYYLRKFIDPKIPDQSTQNSCNWKKIRLAELYLNYAEAENEARGPGTEVFTAVNTVRNRSNMPSLPATLNQAQLRERIRKERRVEFAFEELRFWDVRRWKILEKTDKLVTGMEPVKNSNGSFSYERFVVRRTNVAENKYLLFPIPTKDASIIPDFGRNQNPGW